MAATTPGPPYQGAVTLAGQIPGATLVSWDRGGHIGLGDDPHIDAAIHTLLHDTATPTDM